MSPVRAGWPRTTALLASLALGVVTGAVAWQLADRLTAPDRGIAGQPPVIVHDTRAFVSLEEYQSVSVVVNLFNLGHSPVDVVDLDVPGWRISDELAPAARTLPAGEWTHLALDLVADCKATTSPDTALEIRTDQGAEFRTELDEELHWRHRVSCQEDELTGDLEIGEIKARSGTGSMQVMIEVENNLDRDATLTDLIVDGGADLGPFTVADPFPTTLAPGESTTVATEWTIECTQLDHLHGLYVHLEYEQGVSRGGGYYMEMPADVITELARFTVDQCG